MWVGIRVSKRFSMSEKEFFNSTTYSYTEEARTVDREVDQALRPIFTAWCDKGYSPRDMMHIAISVALSLCCEKVARLAIAARAAAKAEKEKNNG
jgi:hypothetical protein